MKLQDFVNLGAGPGQGDEGWNGRELAREATGEHRGTEPRLSSRMRRAPVRLLALMALVILAGLILAFARVTNREPDPWAGFPIQHIEGVFVDVDGDGRLDLIVRGEVLFNVPFEITPTPPG